MSIVYELEKKSSLVTRAFSAKSCTRDTDSLHSCTRLRLVQEMACLYHECKILPRKHSYPNLIPIFMIVLHFTALKFAKMGLHWVKSLLLCWQNKCTYKCLFTLSQCKLKSIAHIVKLIHHSTIDGTLMTRCFTTNTINVLSHGFNYSKSHNHYRLWYAMGFVNSFTI